MMEKGINTERERKKEIEKRCRQPEFYHWCDEKIGDSS
jgi:hypothetical protein